VILAGCTAKRLQKKIPDYLRYFRHDVPLAVVEAKSNIKPAGNGLPQAKEYAELLGLKFADSTGAAQNGPRASLDLTHQWTPEYYTQRYFARPLVSRRSAKARVRETPDSRDEQVRTPAHLNRASQRTRPALPPRVPGWGLRPRP
jgi:hypothetical protein